MRVFGVIIGITLLIVISFVVIFINTYPSFGGKNSSADIKRFSNSDNFYDGVFNNLSTTNMNMSLLDMMSLGYKFLFDKNNRFPKKEPPINSIDSNKINNIKDDFAMVWFGHSTFYVKLDGYHILLDPMFSEVPAPLPFLGNKRFQSKLPLNIDDLPEIDFVFISHDHYDHLDYESIIRLSQRVKHFYVPLGVSNHLEEWGVEKDRILEFDWWDSIELNNLNITFTPARHFSGRNINNRFSSLWGSWVINGLNTNLFFSGDSGYDSHFKTIGDKYGPFDYALMECGQYNKLWCNIHMMPEETAQAAIDVQAKTTIPIHWGSFALAFHEWNEPVERFTKKADELNLNFMVPKVGEIIYKNNKNELNKWWINE